MKKVKTLKIGETRFNVYAPGPKDKDMIKLEVQHLEPDSEELLTTGMVVDMTLVELYNLCVVLGDAGKKIGELKKRNPRMVGVKDSRYLNWMEYRDKVI